MTKRPGAPVPGFGPVAVAVLAVTAVVAVTTDQLTKHLATQQLDPAEPVRLLGGAIYLSLIRNSGAAFSLGSGYTWVFSVITLGVIGWIFWMARRLRSVPWAISLGLVLGGALGNLGDRLFRAPGPLLGHVVDMVSLFAPYGQRFAVFNVADSCLTVGVGLAVLLELTGRQRDGSRAGTTPGTADTGTPETGDSETGAPDIGSPWTGEPDLGAPNADTRDAGATGAGEGTR